jgi:hypothetical protein
MRSSFKTVFYTALLMSLPAVVGAQSAIGIRGGLNYASFSGDDAGDFERASVYNFGAFFKTPLTDVLGVQVGAGFAQRGAELTDDGAVQKFTLSYLEIPLLLTLSPPPVGRVGVTFSVGPALGFNTGCNAKVTGATGIIGLDTECENDPINAEVKSFDVGAMVGLGVDINLTESVSLVLDGFYNYGFTKFDDSGVDDDVKHRAFSLLIGLAFLAG